VYDRWEYDVPASTSEEDAIKVPLRISQGVIQQISIGFPSGCGAYDPITGLTTLLARCRLWCGSTPVVPRSPSHYIAADSYIVEIPNQEFEVTKGRTTLTWEVWNLDDVFSHELWIGINWRQFEEEDEVLPTLLRIEKQLQDLNVKLGYLVGVG